MNTLDEIREIALKTKNPESQYNLAQAYDKINQFGNPNPYFNNFKRLYWYMRAGNNGYGEAFNNLAFIIEHELNVKNKEKRFLEYYKKSADMGSKLGNENYILTIKQLKKNE